ncbi:hypothetical protein [Trinickia sp.]|uniref:hypothetical protein n=1 Tax=Trinickia sp. TaxID=2571163 RepID=UPI003F7FE152
MTPTAPPPDLSPVFGPDSAAPGDPSRLSGGALFENEVLAALPVLERDTAWGIDVSPPLRTLTTRLVRPRSHAAHEPYVAWLERLCSARTMASLSGAARDLASSRLAAIRTRGRTTFDAVQEVARPLWPDLLAAWAGLPDQQRRRLHHLGPVVHAFAEPCELPAHRLAGLVTALDELRRIFTQAYRHPRYEHGLPNLFAALETGWTSRLGPIAEEAAAAAIQLLVTGGRAACELTGPAIDTLASQPELVERLRATPGSAAAFVAKVQGALAPPPATLYGTRARTSDAFEPLSRLLAPMLATAVVDALIASRAPIARDEQGAGVHLQRATVTPLEHLALRAGP